MRFQEQLKILNDSMQLLILKTNTVNTTLGERHTILNMAEISKAVNLLQSFTYLDLELKEVTQLGFLGNSVQRSVALNTNQLEDIRDKIRKLRNKVEQNVLILQNTIKMVDKDTLCIKIVEHDSLKEISEELEILDKIIMQTISHKAINATYKFSSFDVGSAWIYIVITSTVGLNLLAGLIWSACVIRKKWLEGSVLEESVKALKIKNDSLKDIQEANKKQMDLLLENEAKNLMEEFELENTDNEYLKRLEFSIKELAKLIIDGVQIKPADLLPEESKNLFPDYSNLDAIESKIKLLERK